MNVIDWSPEELGARAAMLPSTVSQLPLFSGDQIEQSGTFKEAAAAAFSRENVYWDLGRKLYSTATRGDDVAQHDPNFNVYGWLKGNLDKETYQKLMPEIADGLFQDVISPAHAQWKVEEVMREKQLVQSMEQNWLGSLAGSLGGALADPINFVPVGGWFSTGSKIVRVGKTALFAALTTAPQEAALYASQDLRSWKESMLNVGSAAVIGGGIGALSMAFSKAHPLHPENVINPLHPDNMTRQGVVSRVPGEGEDVIDFAGSTTGATQAPLDAPKRLGEKTVVGKLFTSVTPAGRVLNYTADSARSILTRLMDLGGVLTDTNRFGVRTALSAEDLKRDYLTEFSKVLLKGEDIHDETSRLLGDINAPKMDPADLNATTQKILVGTLTDEHRAALAAKYGQNAVQVIENQATKYANEIHQTNELFERKLVERGFMQDSGAVNQLQSKITQNRARRDAELKTVEEAEKVAKADYKEAVKTAADDTAKRTLAADHSAKLEELEAKRAEIKEQYDTAALEKELDYQKALPVPMGRDYGHAQMWDASAITAKHEEARGFLLRVLSDHPEGDWLSDRFGMTIDQFKALKASDPAQYQKILTEWSGDEFVHRISVLEEQVKAAEAAVKQSTLDFNDVLRGLGYLRREERAAKLSEARKFRDKINTDIQTARQRKETLEVERRTVQTAIQTAMQREFDRANTFTIRGPDVGAKELEALTRSENSLNLLEGISKDKPVTSELGQVNTILGEIGKRVTPDEFVKDALVSDYQRAAIILPDGTFWVLNKGVGHADIGKALGKTERPYAEVTTAGVDGAGISSDLPLTKQQKQVIDRLTARYRRENVSASVDVYAPGDAVGRVGSEGIDRIATSEMAATVDPLVAPKAPEPELTTDLATLKERLNGLNRQLVKEDSRLRRLEEAKSRVDAAHAEADAKLDVLTKARQATADALADVRKARGIAETDLNKVKRQLLKAQKRTPLDQAVDDLVETLSNRATLPSGIMDRVGVDKLTTTGRMKERRLILTREQRIEAEAAGFLRTDLPNILHRQYDQLAGHLGIREALDIGRGRTFESWQDVLGKVQDEYNTLTSKAGDPKKVAKLNAERKQVLDDLELLKSRLTGMENPGADRDGWTLWGSRKLRQANFVRFGSGFLVSSLTDVAAVGLRHRVLPLLRDHGFEALKEAMSTAPKSELRALVNATEIGSHALMGMSRFDADDMVQQMGIGVAGTMKHTLTSNVDRAFSAVSNAVTKYSGMPAWNRFWKIASGLQMASKLKELTAAYDTISDLKKADLASLGIGRTEAKRLNEFISKFGAETNGVFDPRLEEWGKHPGGLEAARDFRVAIQRDMTRSVNTPGIGDTPAIMDKWYGKLWLQFQTFAFTFVNRYMEPVLQRALHFHDLQAAGSFAMLMAISAGIMAIKDVMRGEDPAKRLEPGQELKTATELIDRSGLMGYLSPYVNSGLKLSGFDGASKYQRSKWFEQILGINSALIGDVGRFGASVAEGEDSDKILKKGLVLAPFGNWLRLGHHLIE